jgi:hypothetical protein
MRERKSYGMNVEERRLLNVHEAQDRYALGRQSLMAWARGCGAIVRFGKVMLFDREKLDQSLNERTASL